MSGDIRTAALNRSLTTTLAADDTLFANGVATTTKLLVRVSLRVSAADGHGGLRFNLRLPTGSVGFMFEPWLYAPLDGFRQPALVIPEDGIGINIGASAQDYFLFDNGGAAFSGVVFGTVALRTGGTSGTIALEWCQNRSVAVATTLGVGSGFSAGAP